MSKKNQHVVPHPKGWAIKGAGNERYTKIVDTQAKATLKAKQIAKNQESELLVHSRNGQIREKNTYGKDPIKSKG